MSDIKSQDETTQNVAELPIMEQTEQFEVFMDKVRQLKENGGILIFADNVYPFESEGLPQFWAVVNAATGNTNQISNTDATVHRAITLAKLKSDLKDKWFEEELTSKNLRGYLPSDLANNILDNIDTRGKKYAGKKIIHAIPANWKPKNFREKGVAEQIVNNLVELVFTSTSYRNIEKANIPATKAEIKNLIIQETGYLESEP